MDTEEESSKACVAAGGSRQNKSDGEGEDGMGCGIRDGQGDPGGDGNRRVPGLALLG